MKRPYAQLPTAIALCLSVSSVIASEIPFKSEHAEAEMDVLRGGGVMLAMACALGGLLFMLKRRYGGLASSVRKEKHVALLETLKISPHSTVHVIQFGNAHYLLAEAQHGLTCLASHVTEGKAS